MSPPRADSSSTFIMVVSFGRCIFRLSSESVGFMLQASLGGSADYFSVSQLADRVFRFSISSKIVGFHIYNIKMINQEFRAFFNIWNSGGPNWLSEFRNYLKEEYSSWKLIHGKKYISYADVVRSPPLSGANDVPVLKKNLFDSRREGDVFTSGRTSIFKRLSFYFSSRRFGSSVLRNSSAIAKNKAYSSSLAKNRASSSGLFKSDFNGGLYSRFIPRGRRGYSGY